MSQTNYNWWQPLYSFKYFKPQEGKKKLLPSIYCSLTWILKTGIQQLVSKSISLCAQLKEYHLLKLSPGFKWDDSQEIVEI